MTRGLQVFEYWPRPFWLLFGAMLKSNRTNMPLNDKLQKKDLSQQINVPHDLMSFS